MCPELHSRAHTIFLFFKVSLNQEPLAHFTHCRMVDSKPSPSISCGFQVLQQRKARHSVWELAVHIFSAQSSYWPTRETGPWSIHSEYPVSPLPATIRGIFVLTRRRQGLERCRSLKEWALLFQRLGFSSQHISQAACPEQSVTPAPRASAAFGLHGHLSSCAHPY